MDDENRTVFLCHAAEKMSQVCSQASFYYLMMAAPYFESQLNKNRKLEDEDDDANSRSSSGWLSSNPSTPRTRRKSFYKGYHSMTSSSPVGTPNASIKNVGRKKLPVITRDHSELILPFQERVCAKCGCVFALCPPERVRRKGLRFRRLHIVCKLCKSLIWKGRPESVFRNAQTLVSKDHVLTPQLTANGKILPHAHDHEQSPLVIRSFNSLPTTPTSDASFGTGQLSVLTQPSSLSKRGKDETRLRNSSQKNSKPKQKKQREKQQRKDNLKALLHREDQKKSRATPKKGCMFTLRDALADYK